MDPVYTQADFFENKEPLKIESSSQKLLKYRLWLYGISLVHFVLLAMWLLPVDFTRSEIPQVQRMQYMRHLLITAWTNYMFIVYLPLAFYVDWHEMKGRHCEDRIKKLSKFRHYFFMAIMNPTILFTGSFFWRVWHMDREAIVPSVFDEYVSPYFHHNMHTVTMVVCLMDLCAVPRFKPRTTYYQELGLKVFLAVYLLVGLIVNDYTGFWPYPFFYYFTPLWVCVFIFAFYVENLFIYHIQWLIPEFIWGPRLNGEIVKKNSSTNKLKL